MLNKTSCKLLVTDVSPRRLWYRAIFHVADLKAVCHCSTAVVSRPVILAKTRPLQLIAVLGDCAHLCTHKKGLLDLSSINPEHCNMLVPLIAICSQKVRQGSVPAARVAEREREREIA